MHIDIHQHLWPPELIAALRARSRPPLLEGRGDRPTLRMTHEPDGVVDLTRHALDTRLEVMAEADIDLAVVSLSAPLGIEALPQAESSELVAAYHEGLEAIIRRSGGRLAGWAAPSLAAADAGATAVGPMLDRGFAGAMVPSEAVCGPEAIARAAPVLDLLAARGRALFVHPGPAVGTPPYAPAAGMPAWWTNVGIYPGLSIRAYFGWRALGAARWPGLRVCFAIMGGAGPFLEERWRAFGGEAAAVDRNLFLDTASAGRLALECAMATFGVEQIVFGTDIPVIRGEVTRRALADMGAAAERAVVHANPLRLLDRREPP